jgi:PAS domain S-box-containing protein
MHRVPFLRKTSINHKQTLIVMLASGVALLLACAAFATYEVMTFRAVMEQNLSTLADIIGNNSAAALDFSDPKAARETLAALHTEPHIEGACIYTASGDVFAVYDRANDGKRFFPPAGPADGPYFSQDSLQLFLPIMRNGEHLGTVYVVSDLNELYSRLDRYALIAIGVFFASSLAAFLISSQLQRLVSGPILTLVATARAVTVEKNYSVRAIKHSDDELGVLIDAFNEMLKQIQERDVALQKSHVELEKRVTERTREVEENRRLLDGILENSVDGIMAFEAVREPHGALMDFRFLLVNLTAERLLRQPAAELVGQRLLTGSCDLVLDGLFESFVRIVETGATLDFEYSAVRFNVMRWYRLAGVKFGDGLVMSYSDITERKMAEEKLERLRNEHKDVLNSVGEGVHWLNAEGRVKFENPAATKMLGYEPSELIGKAAHVTMHHTRADGTPYPATECPIYLTLNDRTVRHVKDEVFWRKDNTSFPVEYTCTPINDEHGNFGGVVVVFTDVTQRKLAEAKLEQMHRQLLDTSRQAGMAEVATSVLHNVGNVLNSINVSSTLVSDRVRKSKVASLSKVVALLDEHAADLGAFMSSDPKGRQLPHYLQQLAEHLAGEQAIVLEELALLHRNIEHVKDIVVMQQSYAKISGVVETVKINDLVEDALRLNLGALQRHGVTVLREFEDLPPVDVEKHKILQILVNLVRNAKYACDESIRIDKLMTLRVARNDGHVKISVTDNGVGIPAENLTRIFNHGFTTRKDGHGFGLHSAVLAAMEMGGSLSVHSDGAGEGATFTLELPYSPHLTLPENP